jgi:hypothetical protein
MFAKSHPNLDYREQFWVLFTWQQRFESLLREGFESSRSPAKLAKRFESSNLDSRTVSPLPVCAGGLAGACRACSRRGGQSPWAGKTTSWHCAHPQPGWRSSPPWARSRKRTASPSIPSRSSRCTSRCRSRLRFWAPGSLRSCFRRPRTRWRRWAWTSWTPGLSSIPFRQSGRTRDTRRGRQIPSRCR